MKSFLMDWIGALDPFTRMEQTKYYQEIMRAKACLSNVFRILGNSGVKRLLWEGKEKHNHRQNQIIHVRWSLL